jgi:hypothetical protein
MRADLSGGMTVSAFNSKYAGGGFSPIAASRQVGAAAPAAGPAPGGTGSSQEAAWNASLTNLAAQQKADFDAMINRQNTQQDGLFGQYTSAINGQEKLPDMYKRLQDEAGLPQANAQLQMYKDQIYRTKDMLDRLDEDVTSRNLGSMTTEAMRRRILASEGEDLNNQLGRLGTGMAPVVDLVNGAQSSVNALMPLYMQQQQRELQPLELQINSLSDRFAREITGFTQNRETQLTVLMDQVDRGRQLADRDWQLAQQLAAEEREFQRQRSLIAQQASYMQPQSYSSSSYSAPAVTTRQLPGISAPAPKPATNTSGVKTTSSGAYPTVSQVIKPSFTFNNTALPGILKK